MLRTLNNRRRHRFVPSLGLGASTLESRELLSAIVSQPGSHSSPPNGSVGPIIANSVTTQAPGPGHGTPPNGEVPPIIA